MTELDLDQLRALAAAVSEGTFEAAARTLHITPSAVSQRIKALETRTGRVLVQRSKPVLATPSGEVLLRAARQLESVATDVADALGEESSGPRRVVLAANADTLATWLLPALIAVSSELTVEVLRDDETRTAARLRDGSVMAAVTVSREPVAGCTVRRLGAMRYRACAAPAFVRRWLPYGGTIEELARAPIVCFDRADLLQDRYLRRRTRRRLDPPRHYVPGSEAFATAIALGLGWGMVPEAQRAAPRDAGEFVGFDDERPLDVPLFWQQWRLRSAALDRLAEAVREAAITGLI